MNQLAERRLNTLPQVDRKLEALQGCLNELKTADRDLIHAVYREETAISEIAESTGRALQTLYNRLSLLRSRLLECVQRKLATQGGQT